MELKSNIRGLIPQEWVRVQINEIVSTLGDGIHSTPIYSSNGDYYFINGNNLSDGKIVLDGATKRVNHVEYLKYKKNLNNNTILLSINGTIGNVAFYKNEPVILGKSAAYLTVKKEFSSEYLYYFLQSSSALNFFKDGLTGSTIKNLGLGVIRNTPISLPVNKAEQTSIAKALSDADAWIQSLTQLIAKKRQIKQGAMQTLLNPFKNGKLKEGWKLETLSKCTEVDPENLSSNTDAKYEFHYISLEDVSNGLLKSYSTQIFSNAPSRARRIVKAGDVLIGTVRPNLKSHCIFYGPKQNWVCSTGFAVIRCMKKSINEYFLFSSFFCEFIDKQINTLISGSNYPAISSSDVKELNFASPPIDEQNRVAEILKDMDSNINFFESKLKKAKQIKQGMMQNLLTGRIRLI